MAWLSDRLTSAKKASVMWQGLSSAISQTFSWRLDAVSETLQKNRSYLTMSDEEINIVQRELGSFFSVMDVDREKGLALIHRLDQIHLKETDFAITDMIERSFDDVNIEWMKTYAPIDTVTHPYGSRLITESEYNLYTEEQKAQHFLTSRGRITLSLNTFMPEQSVIDEMYDTIKNKIAPLIPLTTVFDGFFVQVQINVVFNIDHYSTVVAPVKDIFVLGDDVTSQVYSSESIEDNFYIKDDVFSVDSDTRAIRKPFDDRSVPLLDEVPLGAWPLGMPYNPYQYLESYKAPNLHELELFSAGGFTAVGCGLVEDGARVNVSHTGTDNGLIYKTLSLELNEFYFIRFVKDSPAGRALVSLNNGVEGVELELCDHAGSEGVYSGKFKAKSITMYLVLACGASPNASFLDFSLKKMLSHN